MMAFDVKLCFYGIFVEIFGLKNLNLSKIHKANPLLFVFFNITT